MHIASRNALALERYFPELIDPLKAALPDRCIVDGEVVIATDHGLDFDALQLRIHPAASRVRMLAEQTPASVVLFDLLALGDDDLRERPLQRAARRSLVGAVTSSTMVGVTPQTADPDEATIVVHALRRRRSRRRRRQGSGGAVPSRGAALGQGEAPAHRRLRGRRVPDRQGGTGIGSLLLGLYAGDGVLHYVGHTSSFDAAERRAIFEQLQPLVGGDSFGHGRTPGGPSRWARAAETSWTSVRPELVCEVSFDHLQSGRFRHASRFLRWRPDKAPRDCDFRPAVAAGGLLPADILLNPRA